MDPELLLRRLEREKLAREEAERLLEEKSRELFDARRAAEFRAEALAEASRVQSRFLANVSHEVRTPMNAVLGILDEAATWRLDPEPAELLAVARRSAAELLTLLNDLLDLSKLEARQMDLYPQPTLLPTMVEDVRDLFLASAAAKGIALSGATEGLEGTVNVDPARLLQILSNLVSNAIRYTDEGAVSIHAARGEGNIVRFTVEDSGRGIAPEDQRKIFGSFVQAHAELTIGGTGLGLSIAHALVSTMGGRIGVESEVGSGATFWFEVPCPPVAAAEGPSLTVVSTSDDLGLRVLVVDDNPVNRMVLVRMLKGLGCIATEAESGEASLEIGARQEFDVVLMDLRMPGIDGLEAGRRLRQIRPQLPILACSASVLEEDRREAQQVGMAGFVPKPVRRHDLYDALARTQSTSYPLAA